MLNTDKTIGVRDVFTYTELVKIRLRAYRNGSWRRLATVEKALFKASIELAKVRGVIVNPSLISRLRSIVSKLFQTVATKILQLGKEYASYLLKLYSKNGILKYLPEVKNLLNDPRYILWLGVKQFWIKHIGWSL